MLGGTCFRLVPPKLRQVMDVSRGHAPRENFRSSTPEA
jgi:hypothetical protein